MTKYARRCDATGRGINAVSIDRELQISWSGSRDIKQVHCAMS